MNAADDKNGLYDLAAEARRVATNEVLADLGREKRRLIMFHAEHHRILQSLASSHRRIKKQEEKIYKLQKLPSIWAEEDDRQSKA